MDELVPALPYSKVSTLKTTARRLIDAYFWFTLFVFAAGGVSWNDRSHLTFPVDLLRIGTIAYALFRVCGLMRMRETRIYRWIDRSWTEVFAPSEVPLVNRLRNSGIGTRACIVLAAWFAACFVLMPLYRHWNFGSWQWDLGVIENAIYNGSRDLSFRSFLLLNENTGEPIRYFPYNRLDFSLFFFAGIFRFLPYTEILLGLQSVALLSGIVPAVLLARRVFPEGFPIWFAAIFYFCFDTIHRLNLWDIHGQAYVVPISLWAVYFIESQRWSLAVTFMFLSAIWREDAWLVFCGLAIYFGLRSRRYGFAAFLFLLGLPILPLFSAGFQRITPLNERYSYLGKDFSEAFARLKETPWLPVRFMIENPSNRDFIAQLVLRGGFGAFAFAGLGPLVALMVPLSEVLLASNPVMHNWLNHYVGTFAGLLIACAFIGWGRLMKIADSPYVPAILSGMAAISIAQLSYLEPSHVRAAITRYPESECLRSIVDGIPKEAKVLTNDPLITHLDKRTHIGKVRVEFDQSWADTIVTSNPDEVETKGPWKTLRRECGYWIATR